MKKGVDVQEVLDSLPPDEQEGFIKRLKIEAGVEVKPRRKRHREGVFPSSGFEDMIEAEEMRMSEAVPHKLTMKEIVFLLQSHPYPHPGGKQRLPNYRTFQDAYFEQRLLREWEQVVRQYLPDISGMPQAPQQLDGWAKGLVATDFRCPYASTDTNESAKLCRSVIATLEKIAASGR